MSKNSDILEAREDLKTLILKVERIYDTVMPHSPTGCWCKDFLKSANTFHDEIASW